MNVEEAIRTRYSVRKYQDKPLNEKDLKEILDLARLAPSAHNSQNYKIILVTDRDKIEKLADITRMVFIAQAPAVLVGVTPDPFNEYWKVDMSIIFDHITLLAHEKGIGTCWVGSIKDEAKIRDVVEAPEDSKALIVMPLGYPDHKALPKKRKEFEEIYSVDKFEN